MTGVTAFEKNSLVRRALRLEIVTIIWMVIEAVAAIGAGIAARSLLLVAFGIDSGIELTSAIVVYRRFCIEKFAGNLAGAGAIESKTAHCRLPPLVAFCIRRGSSCPWSPDASRG